MFLLSCTQIVIVELQEYNRSFRYSNDHLTCNLTHLPVLGDPSDHHTVDGPLVILPYMECGVT